MPNPTPSPCPFCGSKNIDDDGECNICTNCGSIASHAAWNLRADNTERDRMAWEVRLAMLHTPSCPVKTEAVAFDVVDAFLAERTRQRSGNSESGGAE